MSSNLEWIALIRQKFSSAPSSVERQILLAQFIDALLLVHKKIPQIGHLSSYGSATYGGCSKMGGSITHGGSGQWP